MNKGPCSEVLLKTTALDVEGAGLVGEGLIVIERGASPLGVVGLGAVANRVTAHAVGSIEPREDCLVLLALDAVDEVSADALVAREIRREATLWRYDEGLVRQVAYGGVASVVAGR